MMGIFHECLCKRVFCMAGRVLEVTENVSTFGFNAILPRYKPELAIKQVELEITLRIWISRKILPSCKYVHVYMGGIFTF